MKFALTDEHRKYLVTHMHSNNGVDDWLLPSSNTEAFATCSTRSIFILWMMVDQIITKEQSLLVV